MVWNEGELTISDEKTLLPVDCVCRLLEGTFKEARSRERNELAIKNSVCFGVYKKDELIGYARVVTDYATIYWICDFVIEKEYRGKGLGKKLVKCIFDSIGHKCELGILGTKDAHGFYEKCEFTKDPGLFMFRVTKKYR